MTPREVHCSWTDGQMAGSRVQAGKGGAKEAKGQKILKVMMGRRRSTPLRRTTNTNRSRPHWSHSKIIRSHKQPAWSPLTSIQAFSESPQRSIEDFGGISEPTSSNYNTKGNFNDFGPPQKNKSNQQDCVESEKIPSRPGHRSLEGYVKATGLVFASVKTLNLSSNESLWNVVEVAALENRPAVYICHETGLK